jgi:hypothetical protein
MIGFVSTGVKRVPVYDGDRKIGYLEEGNILKSLDGSRVARITKFKASISTSVCGSSKVWGSYGRWREAYCK